MFFSEEINNELSRLNKLSGLKLTIEDTDLTDDEIINKLSALNDRFEGVTDRSGFLYNLVTGNMNTDQLLHGMAKYHIKSSSLFSLYVIKSTHAYSEDVPRLLHSVLPGAKDSLIELSDNRILIIRELSKAMTAEDIDDLAAAIISALETEAMMSFKIGYSSRCAILAQLSELFENACSALDIGFSFYNQMSIYSYERLGLGRLLHSISKEEAQAFLKNECNLEVLKDIDEETRGIIKSFFENDLSLAETARNLFMHRNTLIYKLDKFAANTGLDVRHFRDALTVSLGLMLLDNVNK